MKTLGKLKINPERILKNDELIIIRGSYGWCDFYNADYGWGGGYFQNQQECDAWLDEHFHPDNYCSCA
jgi:hypothetical protein